MQRFLITCFISIGVVSGIAAQTPPDRPANPPDYIGPVNTTGISADRPVPKQISGGVLNGKALSLPKPDYPAAARAVKASGAVSVQVLIDESGTVVSASAVSGHPLLRAVSVEAARLAQFAPTLLNGQPVKVSGVITYNFVYEAPATERGLLGQIPVRDRDKIWAIGFFLAFVQTADAETIRMIGDEKEFHSILSDFPKDLPPDMAEYKPILERLGSSDSAVRSEAAGDFLKLARKDLNAEQNWQVDVGEQLGLTMVELLRQKIQYVKTGVALDTNIIRSHLGRISDLVTNAPEGASAEYKARFKRIAAFANAPDLSQEPKIAELMNELEPLFAAFDENE